MLDVMLIFSRAKLPWQWFRIEINIILRAEIEEHEKKTLDSVKGLLRKYEKYRVS